MPVVLTPEPLGRVKEAKRADLYNFGEYKFEPNDTLDSLVQAITEADQKFMDSKGSLVTVGQTKIRVFNGDQQYDYSSQDLYARALMHARAMLGIIKLEELENSGDTKYIKDLVSDYIEQMKNAQNEDLEQAQKKAANFIGQMAQKLAQIRNKTSQPDDAAYNQAFIDIKKAVELFSSLEPTEDALCTVTTEGDKTQIQLSEKLSFSKGEKTLETEKEKAWFKQAHQKHGAWFEKFLKNNFTAFIQASPPCTTRDTPNAANAWQETFLVADNNNQIVLQNKKVRSAISSPFNVKDFGARIDMARDSTKQLLSDERLEQLAQEHIDKWGDKGPIIIPIMHQTLVAPGIPGLQSDDLAMIEVKRQANREVKKYLQDKTIKVNGKQVKFELLETNNCINMWHPIIVPADNDIEDSNKLVNYAIKVLENQSITYNQGSLNNLTKYLQKPNTSLFGLGYRMSKDELSSYNFLIKEPSLSKEARLVLQAAVNLKQLNHESIFGFAARKLKNAIRIKGFPVLAPVVGLITSPVYAVRYAVNVIGRAITHFRDGAPPLVSEIFMPTRNKQTYKSAYESILGGQLGLTFGGCKSAFDREGEVNVNKAAMLSKFEQEGVLPTGLGTDKNHYDFVNKYVLAKEKSAHQTRVAAHTDRIGARKLWEVRNYQYVNQDPAAKSRQKNYSKFRKLKAPPKQEQLESNKDIKKVDLPDIAFEIYNQAIRALKHPNYPDSLQRLEALCNTHFLTQKMSEDEYDALIKAIEGNPDAKTSYNQVQLDNVKQILDQRAKPVETQALNTHTAGDTPTNTPISPTSDIIPVTNSIILKLINDKYKKLDSFYYKIFAKDRETLRVIYHKLENTIQKNLFKPIAQQDLTDNLGANDDPDLRKNIQKLLRDPNSDISDLLSKIHKEFNTDVSETAAQTPNPVVNQYEKHKKYTEVTITLEQAQNHPEIVEENTEQDIKNALPEGLANNQPEDVQETLTSTVSTFGYVPVEVPQDISVLNYVNPRDLSKKLSATFSNDRITVKSNDYQALAKIINAYQAQGKTFNITNVPPENHQEIIDKLKKHGLTQTPLSQKSISRQTMS